MTEIQPLPYLAMTAGAEAPARELKAVDAPAIVTPISDRTHAVPKLSLPEVEIPEQPEGKPAVDRPSPDSPSGNGWLHVRLLVADVVAVSISWLLIGSQLVSASTLAARIAPGLAATAVMLVAMRCTGLYRSRICARRTDELWRLFLSCLWGAAAFVMVEWQIASAGAEVLVCVASALVITGVARWQFARWLRARRAEGRFLRGVVLVGSNEDAAGLATMLHSEPELGYVVTAVVGESADDSSWQEYPHGLTFADIPRLAEVTGASGILIVPYALSSTSTQRAIDVASAANLHIQVWPGFRGVGSRRLRNVPISGEAFFYVEPKLSARWQFAAKRAIDVIGAATVLTLTSPLLLAAAICILLEDRGPVLYRDERVGLHGKTFRICKMRSMTSRPDPEPETLSALNERTDGPLFKASNDPRVTKVGRYIRATSVDELPQLWCVLLGTMSLVGPRPALPDEVSQFDQDFQRRHSFRPGMTGLWQVEARTNPSFNAYRRLDLRYVDNWSITQDLSILLTTIPSVLSQAVGSFKRSRRRHRA